MGNVNEERNRQSSIQGSKTGVMDTIKSEDSLIVNDNVFQNLPRTVKQVMRISMSLTVW